MKGLIYCCAALLVFQQVLAAEPLKRRKLRRKVIKTSKPEENAEEEDRDGRGFLDDYYSQFEERVTDSLIDRQGFQSDTARMDHAYATEYEDSSPRHMPSDDQDYGLQALRQKQVNRPFTFNINSVRSLNRI